MQYHSRVLPFAVTTALLAAPCAVAAEWSVDPILQWRMDYDSNRLLSAARPQGGEGLTLALDALLRGTSDTSELDLTPHVDLQRFHPQSDFDATNASLQLAAQTRTERSSVGLTAGYERASTLTTEPADTGVIDAAIRRETTNAGLSVTHELTERQQLELQGSYTDARYPGGLRLGLIGYNFPSLSLAYTASLSERTTVSLTPYADRLTAPQTSYQSDDRGARLTVRHSFSDLLSASIAAGYSESVLPQGRAHGTLWHLEATRKRDELTQWTLAWDRAVQPSGYSILVRRDDLALTFSRTIAPLWAVTLSAHDVRNADLRRGVQFDVPHYSLADAGLEWRPTATWTVSLTAGVERLHEARGTDIADGRHAAVTLRWSPIPYFITR